MDIKLFLFLFSISVLPLGIIYQFSPWEIPQVHFFFLGLLFVIRIVFFQEDRYKKNLKPVARAELQRKIGRVPSDPEVIDYIEKLLSGRNVSFIVAIVLCLVITVIFGKWG